MITALTGINLWFANAKSQPDLKNGGNCEVGPLDLEECGLSRFDPINGGTRLQQLHFNNKLKLGIQGEKTYCVIATLLDGCPPKLPEDVSYSTKTFAKRFFQSDPSQRPPAHKLLLSNYLANASITNSSRWTPDAQQVNSCRPTNEHCRVKHLYPQRQHYPTLSRLCSH